MGMKLLSPFATKERQQNELTQKILRIQEIEDLAKQANAKLARAQADFQSVLAQNQAKWANEEAEHTERVKSMTIEVESLENRKKQALIPIQMYKEEVDKAMAEAQEIVKKAKEKEEQADFLLEKLEEKLTDVSDREALVEKEEKRQEVAKQGIESQQRATKEGVERLSKEMMLFHEKCQSEEESLAQRKKELALAEINFNAKIEKYKRDFEALKVWDIQLKDERATLDREYARKK